MMRYVKKAKANHLFGHYKYELLSDIYLILLLVQNVNWQFNLYVIKYGVK